MSTVNKFIGDIVCYPEYPGYWIVPNHRNCKVDAARLETKLAYKMLAQADELFILAKLVPLMHKILYKIHVW